MFGRASRIGEWQFQGGDLSVFPGLWYLRLPESMRLLGIASVRENYAPEKEQKSKRAHLQVSVIHHSTHSRFSLVNSDSIQTSR
jgi:hypothetical protein